MPPKKQPNTEEHLKQVHRYYKKLDLWSLTEGLAILTIPSWIHPADPGSPNIFEHGPLSERCIDIKVFKRAIESGKLKTDGYDKKRVANWKPVDNGHLNYDVQTDYWYSCFDKVTVSPFNFLEFVKEKNLFKIPSELEWVKINDKYLWASEAKGKGYDIPEPFENLIHEDSHGVKEPPSEKPVKNKLRILNQACDRRQSMDIILVDTEYVLYEVETPCPDETIQKTGSQAHHLILKYTKLAIKYCQEFIENGEQTLSRGEVEMLLTQELTKNGDKLGSEKIFPEDKLREIWREVPEGLKRPKGVKTQKRKFELKAGSLPWQI